MRAIILIAALILVSCGDSNREQRDFELAETYLLRKEYDVAEKYIAKLTSPKYLKKKDSLESILSEIYKKQAIKDSADREAARLKAYDDLLVEYLNTRNLLKNKKFSAYHNSPTSLTEEADMFFEKTFLIKKGLNHDSLEISDLSKQIKNYLTAAQISEFPKMRKLYAEFAAQKLWEQDIEVKSSGSGNRYLTFIGGTFAANKNKQDWQEAFSSVFRKLRFKRIYYKWYSHDDGIYYEVDSQEDKQF